MYMHDGTHAHVRVRMSMSMSQAGTLTMATLSNRDDESIVGCPHTRLPLSSAIVSTFLASRAETNSAAR